ncbi:unnamed protein product, partial [marine sediment metagenome]
TAYSHTAGSRGGGDVCAPQVAYEPGYLPGNMDFQRAQRSQY